jgi:hypothetical protein
MTFDLTGGPLRNKIDDPEGQTFLWTVWSVVLKD